MKSFAIVLLIGIFNLCTINHINAINSKESKTGTLNDDFQDFKAVLLAKADKLLVLFDKYLADDKQFRKAIQILYGDKMKQSIQMVDKQPEYEEFLMYLHDNGVEEIYVHVALIHEILNIPLPPFIENNLPKSKSANKHKRDAPQSIDEPGLKELIENVKKLIDIDALVCLFDKKLETSKSFQEFVEYLKSPKFVVFVHAVQNDPHYEAIVKAAIAAGVDVESIEDFLHKRFGW